jgi:glucans biosynthesis protein C
MGSTGAAAAAVAGGAAAAAVAAAAPAGGSERVGVVRLLFIDNIRWVMILFVVSMHAAVTYSSVGSWYYNEPAALSQGAKMGFVTYQFFLQSFFMGFLFFIAGYFVPLAYDKKGGRRFLKDRAVRLGLPTLLYIFLLQPLILYYIIRAWDPDSADRSFLRSYGRYLSSGRWLGGTGPLWFCEALLIFCVGYAGWRMLRAGRVEAGGRPGDVTGSAGRSGDETGTAGRTGIGGLSGVGTATLVGARGGVRAFPGKAKVGGFILLIAVSSFLVRITWPNGTSFYNLQFCYFSQYIFFFIAGTVAYRRSWLTTLPRLTGLFWGRLGLFGGLLLWFVLLITGGALKGQTSVYGGGNHWQSMGLCILESMAGVGISLYCLVLFRDRFNGQGRMARFFSENAFAVYVFHAPVLIAISLGMAGLHWPPLMKFVLLTALSIVATYSICALLIRRIPLLKKIL